jgi:hypothetical protein
MTLDAHLDLPGKPGPDSQDEALGIDLPLDRIICRDADGSPHTIREFVWPWTAYTKNRNRCVLHFYYWNQSKGPVPQSGSYVSPDREARIRELQFLMTRQLYYGSDNAPRTLEAKLRTLYYLGRFAESRRCTIHEVLTQSVLLDAFGTSLPNSYVTRWLIWLSFLRQLDPETQLGFVLAAPKRRKELELRAKECRNNARQHAPLPTRVYAGLINNVSIELDDIEAHTPQLLAALRDGLRMHAQAKAAQGGREISIGRALIEKYGLVDYIARRGFSIEMGLRSLTGAVTEVFQVCKLQIHVFSGMRHEEVRTLPYHCMVTTKGGHGRTHSLIAGITTKLNKGRRLRTHWVTTDREGFRAIRLAQKYADVIYESLGVTPRKSDNRKDDSPLFASPDYLPWSRGQVNVGKQIQSATVNLNQIKKELRLRLVPIIEEQDLAELEEIDQCRAWRDEPEFSIGQQWPLTTHQLRRSLAVYANASGLVSLPSLRRQLQHITQEMSLFYGRGSTFCKNFIAIDPDGYKKHVAPDWQDGEDEAEMLAFTRDVLNSNEPMFGGAGNFYQRQRERGEVMTRQDVVARMKAGLLSYTPGPLGGCTKPGGCDKPKGLAIIDIACATDGCQNLVGKHSKIIRVIQLKRAAMAHITPGSIEASFESEELEALERVEREWRPHVSFSLSAKGGAHA